MKPARRRATPAPGTAAPPRALSVNKKNITKESFLAPTPGTSTRQQLRWNSISATRKKNRRTTRNAVPGDAQTEVCDFELGLGRDQDVGRSQVAVDQVLSVDVRQTRSHLQRTVTTP